MSHTSFTIQIYYSKYSGYHLIDMTCHTLHLRNYSSPVHNCNCGYKMSSNHLSPPPVVFLPTLSACLGIYDIHPNGFRVVSYILVFVQATVSCIFPLFKSIAESAKTSYGAAY